MKEINIRSLTISIAIFIVSGFLVHLLFNPEPTILGTLGYSIFAGIIAGVAFYFIDRKNRATQVVRPSESI
ncbi:MAG TPA: hypothetical protein VFO38_00930 [Candidatus Saccharimonadales bacterium]|nr:hypothetical protein [Candidatus Saccharimonadales bacterium]